MENQSEKSWRKSGDWKSRYSKLYSIRPVPLSRPALEPSRISFMSSEYSPSFRLRLANASQGNTPAASPRNTSFVSWQNGLYGNNQSDDLGGHETKLLDMVRSRRTSEESAEEAKDQALQLPKDDVSDDMSSEACIHGLSLRNTDRSISRSRVSRMSTRRDMDIPSILAFTTTTTAPVQLEIPAFQKASAPKYEEAPRWSIRRSVCPVCSQKWRDRSSITNVKYSGLKRNVSSELPSVMAPARLRTFITLGYNPRPMLAAVDEDAGMSTGGLRSARAKWQFTRARKFRIPKPLKPSPESIAPPSVTAPLALKNLDIRVNRFLSREEEENIPLKY